MWKSKLSTCFWKIKKREKKIFYPELFCIFVVRIRMNCSTNFYKYFRDEKTYF